MSDLYHRSFQINLEHRAGGDHQCVAVLQSPVQGLRLAQLQPDHLGAAEA